MNTFKETSRDLYVSYVATWVFHHTTIPLDTFCFGATGARNCCRTYQDRNVHPQDAALAIIERRPDQKPGECRQEVTCFHCRGEGEFDWDPEHRPDVCPHCLGSGKVWTECSRSCV